MSVISAAELVHTVNDIYLSRLFGGAAATFVVYDWFLVFGDEFETIYRSRWSMPKILFYYIRVVTPPGIILGSFQQIDFRPALSTQVSATDWDDSATDPIAYSCARLNAYGRPKVNGLGSCQGWAIFVVLAMFTSLCAANGLLTLRLIALYKRKASMVWFIGTFYVATYVATFALTIGSIVQFTSSLSYSDAFHICGSLGKSSLMPPIWYAPAAFEAFVFSLTAYRAWGDAALISGKSSAPLLTVLYRDGMISFVVMAGLRVWNIWIYLTQPLSSYNLGTMLMWALNTVLTTRVYMNLVWLVRGPILAGDDTYGTTNPNRSQPPPVFGDVINLRAPVDSYVYTSTFSGSRSRHDFPGSDHKHITGKPGSGSDVPMEVWR